MGPVYFEIFKLEKFVILEQIQCEVSGEKSEKSRKIHGFEHQKLGFAWNRVRSCQIMENQAKSRRSLPTIFRSCAPLLELPMTAAASIPSPVSPSWVNR